MGNPLLNPNHHQPNCFKTTSHGVFFNAIWPILFLPLFLCVFSPGQPVDHVSKAPGSICAGPWSAWCWRCSRRGSTGGCPAPPAACRRCASVAERGGRAEGRGGGREGREGSNNPHQPPKTSKSMRLDGFRLGVHLRDSELQQFLPESSCQRERWVSCRFQLAATRTWPAQKHTQAHRDKQTHPSLQIKLAPPIPLLLGKSAQLKTGSFEVKK